MNVADATIGLWEALCRTCPHWRLTEPTTTVDGEDLGMCGFFSEEGPVSIETETSAVFFCANHPIIRQGRAAHLELTHGLGRFEFESERKH